MCACARDREWLYHRGPGIIKSVGHRERVPSSPIRSQGTQITISTEVCSKDFSLRPLIIPVAVAHLGHLALLDRDTVHPLSLPDAVNGGDAGDGEEGSAGQGQEVGAVREAGEGPLPQGEDGQGGSASGKSARKGCQKDRLENFNLSI